MAPFPRQKEVKLKNHVVKKWLAADPLAILQADHSGKTTPEERLSQFAHNAWECRIPLPLLMTAWDSPPTPPLIFPFKNFQGWVGELVSLRRGIHLLSRWPAFLMKVTFLPTDTWLWKYWLFNCEQPNQSSMTYSFQILVNKFGLSYIWSMNINGILIGSPLL